MVFNLPEWQALVEVEKELREAAILEHIAVRYDDPHKESRRDYWKGQMDAYLSLWSARNNILKRPTGKKIIKGAKHANEKTTNHEETLDTQF